MSRGSALSPLNSQKWECNMHLLSTLPISYKVLSKKRIHDSRFSVTVNICTVE